MKKRILLYVSAFALLFTLNSCGSDSDKDENLVFSTLPVEQQKLQIEQSSAGLISKMSEMEKSTAFVAISQLTSLESPISSQMNELKTGLLKNDVKALTTFGQQMKTASVLQKGIWGERNWNKLTKKYDLVKELTNKAIIRFPGDANATTNTATLTITLVNSTIASSIDGLDFLPLNLSVVLTVGTKEALNAQFTGVYSTEGIPTKLTQTLVVDKYNWLAEVANDGKNASMRYQFNYDKETLLRYELIAAGNFTAAAIQSNEGPKSIITSGSMSFQIMNIGARGSIAVFKGMATEAIALPDDKTKATAEKQVTILNKYLKMYGYFVKEKQKFAEVEFYVVENNDVNYNNLTQKYDKVTVYTFQPRLVLSDGSKQDIKTFLKTGFSANFGSEYQDLIDLLRK